MSTDDRWGAGPEEYSGQDTVEEGADLATEVGLAQAVDRTVPSERLPAPPPGPTPARRAPLPANRPSAAPRGTFAMGPTTRPPVVAPLAATAPAPATPPAPAPAPAPPPPRAATAPLPLPAPTAMPPSAEVPAAIRVPAGPSWWRSVAASRPVQIVRARPWIGAVAGGVLVVLIIVLAVVGGDPARRPSSRGVVAVRTASSFSLGVAVTHAGRVVVVTSLEPVRAAQRGEVYFFHAAGNAEVATGYPARVIATDPTRGLAALEVVGVAPGEVATLALPATRRPADGTPLEPIVSMARYADQLVTPTSGNEARALRPARIEARLAGGAGRTESDAFLISIEDPATRPGLLGGPVYHGGDVVGLTVATGAEGFLVAAPVAEVLAFLGSLDEPRFHDPVADDVQGRLQVRLVELATVVADVDRRWRALAGPRLPGDPPSDLVHTLRHEALPDVSAYLAPTDLGVVDARAAEIAAEIRDRYREDLAPAALRGAVGFAQLRQILGVGEAAQVLAVALGEVPGTYVARVRDSYGETHELCALAEHGAVFLSLFPCPTSSDPDGKHRHRWIGDRELGEVLVGTWVKEPDEVARRGDRPCTGQQYGACLLPGSTLEIVDVAGSRVTGTFTVRHRGWLQHYTDKGKKLTHACKVELRESVEGTLTDGRLRLEGKSSALLDDGAANRDAHRKGCRDLGGQLDGTTPVLFGDDRLGPDNARVDVVVERVVPSLEVLMVTLYWRGATTPWTTQGSEASFRLVRPRAPQ